MLLERFGNLFESLFNGVFHTAILTRPYDILFHIRNN
jgi:hypothetical protein